MEPTDPDRSEGIEFAEALAAATPTPGGGAAAARVGRLATSLVRMVAGISLQKAPPPAARGDDAEHWQQVARVDASAGRLAARFRRLESDDMAAFEGFLGALRLPKGDDEEVAARRRAIRDATVHATEVPLAMLEASAGVLDLVRTLVDLAGSIRLRAEADLGGAVELAYGAFHAAEYNIRVNLPGLRDDPRQEGLRDDWKSRRSSFTRSYEELRDALTDWLA